MENDKGIQITKMDLKRFVYVDQNNGVNLSFDIGLAQVQAFRELLMRAYIDLGLLIGTKQNGGNGTTQK